MKKRVLAILLVVLTACTLFVACNKQNNDSGDVTVKWYFPVDIEEDCLKAANEYIKEKIGVDVNFVLINFGDYDQKMQVLNAGNDKYDIAFTSNWCNNYNKNISNGTIIPLDDLIKEYAQDTYNLIEPEIWDLARVDGKIYGIINQQIMGRAPIMTVPEITLTTLGLNKDDFKSYKDSEKYFRAVKEKTGNYTFVSEIWPNWLSSFGFEEVIGQKVPGAIYIGESIDDVKIINQYETPEFKEYIEWRRKLVLDGLTPPHVAEINNEEIALKSGDSKVVNYMHFQPTYTPGMEATWRKLPNDLGEQVAIAKQKPYMSTSAVTATLNSIAATSKNPEAAMRVLNLINTDKELFNIFACGIEGVNYKKVSENKVEAVEGSKIYNKDCWAIGNTFNTYIKPGQTDDVHDLTKEINSNSMKSVLAGFVPNIDNIKTQIYNCTAVVDEYLQPLDYGVVDIDEAYPEFIKQLKIAEVDEVIDELNRQLGEWKKTK